MYKVQTKTQSTRARQARLGFAILAIATIFATCFFLTQAVMTAVYGLETEGKAYIGLGSSAAAYSDVMDATTQAADEVQGYMINSYILQIKESVCPTLKNITAEAECMNL